VASLIGLFTLLSIVIVVAGIALTRCADRIAELTSIGHSLAGLLLLAAATSIPELSVGWAAVRIQAADLAFGELLGSCLWNLMLLSVLDLATRSRGRMFSRESAAHALIATVGILLAAITLLGLVLDEDYVFLRASPFSWCMIVGYLLCIRLVYRDHHAGVVVGQPAPSTARGPLAAAVVGYLVCVAVIFFAAPKLAVVADRLAEDTGLGDSFLGATFVAMVTSLPEAVTTWAAIRLGRVNMAVANIFGSNAFNLTILATIDFATPVSLMSLASDIHIVAATAVILVTSVALLGILYRAEKRYWLIEPDALLVIILLLGTLWLIYRNGV
jgi:cation:H+ antiporter